MATEVPAHVSSAADMRTNLQALLDLKEKQLQQAGALGQRVLAQQVELEDRVRMLQDMELDRPDADEIDAEMRERYRELAETVRAWDTENATLSSGFGVKRATGPSARTSPALPAVELSREETERPRPAASSSNAQSRRAKNAAHRQDDVEFAFEIGSGLLTEVRRLQSLLGERDKAIQDMKEEKDDLERSIEALQKALKQQEQSTDKYKEENWNLEVMLQEMRTQLTDTQANVQRLEGEHKRLTRALNQTREAVDKHKNEAQTLQTALEELKAKHDTDVAQARKHAASLQRDKSDLQQSLDSLKADVQRNGRRLGPRFGSPLTPDGRPATGNTSLLTPNVDREEDDVFGTHGASTNRRRGEGAYFDGLGEYDSEPDASPTRPTVAPNHPSNEVEALQQRLAHAQRQINTLKGTLQREKEAKIEYRKRLESPGGPAAFGAEADEEEDEDLVGENADPNASARSIAGRKSTPFRVGRGRGRGRGGSLMDRLQRAAKRPAEDDDDDNNPTLTPPPPVPSLPRRTSFAGAEADDDADDFMAPDMSLAPSEPPSRPASIDGMDPAFANVLKRAGSQSSIRGFQRSPLRQSTLGRRNRGGAAFQQARPASLVGAPEALAAELFGDMQVGMDSVAEDHDEVMPVETAEFGCQTEPIPEPEPVYITLPAPEPERIVVTVPAERPESSEASVQVTPEPIPEPVKPVYMSFEVQTDAEPEVVLPVYASADIQTEPEPEPEPIVEESPKVVYASMEMQTDPEPTPEPAPVPVPLPVVEAAPKPEVADAEMQTDAEPAPAPVPVPEPEPPVEVVHAGVQHEDVAPPKTYASSSMETDPMPEPEATPIAIPVPLPETSVAEVQTDAQPTVPAASVVAAALGLGRPSGARVDESRRQTITQSSFTSSRDLSADATITAAIYEAAEESEDDAATETGAETETETDGEFVDARSVMAMTTPTMSLNEYASARSDDEDDASVRPSSTPARSLDAFYAPRVVYEDASVQYEFEEAPKPAPAPVTVVLPPPPPPAPKAEVKEISIQTDEWAPAPILPPASAAMPPPPSPAGANNSFRMPGSGLQQFQYISPPSSAGPTQTSMPTSPIAPREPPVSRPRTSTSDRRQSIESAMSGYVDDPTPRGRLSSAPIPASSSPAPVDKSRPPMMMLPPPPRAPPPANSMPPPSFVPERVRQTSGRDLPPGRPSSPPPPELLQRATTPTFGSVRSHFGSMRAPGSSMPPPAALNQRPSTHSFRSAGQQGYIPASLQSAFAHREMSQTSLQSGGSIGSARSSISSDHPYYHQRGMSAGAAAAARGAPAGGSTESSPAMNGSTDPSVIHAITQTMIGEYLFKYTRKPIGKGYGDRRHKRFFWVHPYTKTLYWSDTDPGSSSASESSAKSAYIEAVRSVLDPNPLPPGLYQYSVVVSTPHREMKITAPTKERHDIWLNALKYLLARPNTVGGPMGGPMSGPMGGTMPRGGPRPMSPDGLSTELPPTEEGRPAGLLSSPQSFRSQRSTNGEWNITPRGQRSRSQISMGGSIGKRSGTPAAEYLRYANDGPYSPTKSFEHVGGPGATDEDEDLDFELHDDSLSDGGFEGLENVRACCDGRHTVGGHHHHHHHHHEHSHAPPTRNGSTQSYLQNGPQPRERSRVRGGQQHLDAQPVDPRPSSPAFSFRSRAGSTTSDGGGLFGGKLRFGSRRMKTPVPQES
ncbi:unnamed protein product [Peniophora sp. CBMAI 1063]|nr:unnamed protein product [Peniophora sp. CBMAI 1063]